MASPFLATATLNLKERKTVTIVSTLILIAAFISMVTSGYTADHINRSSCDKTKDTMLSKAYEWSTASAIISAFIVLGSGALLVYTAMKKKKSA